MFRSSKMWERVTGNTESPTLQNFMYFEFLGHKDSH